VAEISWLTLADHGATDVTRRSSPGTSPISFELDQLTSLAVIQNFETAATVLSIAFSIADIEQIV
jgi:hypothetical protein